MKRITCAANETVGIVDRFEVNLCLPLWTRLSKELGRIRDNRRAIYRLAGFREPHDLLESLQNRPWSELLLTQCFSFVGADETCADFGDDCGASATSAANTVQCTGACTGETCCLPSKCAESKWSVVGCV